MKGASTVPSASNDCNDTIITDVCGMIECRDGLSSGTAIKKDGAPCASGEAAGAKSSQE